MKPNLFPLRARLSRTALSLLLIVSTMTAVASADLAASTEPAAAQNGSFRRPAGSPTTADLSKHTIPTAWPGVASPDTDAKKAVDKDLATSAVTEASPSDGAFIQFDLKTTIDVGVVTITNVGGSCATGTRLLVTDDAGFVGLTVAETDASAALSPAYTEYAVGSGVQRIVVNKPARYLRLQRTGCGSLSLPEIEIIPSSQAVMTDPIFNQWLALGQPVTIPVDLLANTWSQVTVSGLPPGLSYNGSAITGTVNTLGRFPVEIVSLAPDGRTSTNRFNITIVDNQPEGEVRESPALDISRLPSRPSPTVSGVMGNTRGQRISGGNVSDTTASLDITVWDMIELRGHMYVAGEFDRIVNDDETSTPQRYLARFNLSDGSWDDSWRPQLDGNAHALAVSPRGRLLVGGEFTTVNGLPNTAGLVAFNAKTGAVDPTFEAWVERPWNPTKPAVVRDIVVAGRWLYVVGKFSHINGTGGGRQRVFSAARVSANYGTIDTLWKPVVTGRSAWEVSPNHAQNRVYIAGFMDTIANQQGTVGGGTVDASTGQFVADNYFPKNTNGAQEVYGVESFGDVFMLAGSQHFVSVSRVNRSPLGALPESWTYASNNATDQFVWAGSQVNVRNRGMGGDFQFARKIGDYLLTGCHCQDLVDRRGRGSFYNTILNRSLNHKVAIALHLTGPLAFTPVESFKPDIEGGIDGAWTATTDSRGCLWIGGDILDGGLQTGSRIFARGFARFCLPPADNVSNLRASAADVDQVTLDWEVAELNGSEIGFVVRRDGRYLGFVGLDDAPTFTDDTVEPFETYTYSVKPQAGDGTQGLGAEITVQAGDGDPSPPTVPTGVAATRAGDDVSLQWDPSTDDIGVKGYLIYRNGSYIGFTRTTGFLDAQAYELGAVYEVRAEDLFGNQSAKSAEFYEPSKDPLLDDTPPTVPTGIVVSGTEGEATVTWSPSTDGISVSGYLIYRNGAYIGYRATAPFVDTAASYGDVYTLRAQDQSNNRSEASAGVEFVNPAGPDVTAPSTPVDVVAEVTADGVALTWAASTDDRGVVSGYLIYRDGSYLAYRTGTSYTDAGGQVGSRYDIRAVDPADNRSEKSVEVVVGGTDTTAPTVPTDLAAALTADGVTLTWTAATDDRGVAGYLIYRDGAYVAYRTGTVFEDPDGVRGSRYDIRATDAASNRSAKSADVLAGDPDTEPPTVPVGLIGQLNGADVDLSWAASTDDIATTGYLVYRNGAYLGFSSGLSFTDVGAPAGSNSYDLRATDAAENRSEKSDPVVVVVP
jgi:hypothetical protein